MPSLISGCFCGLSARMIYNVLPLDNKLSLPIAVFAGGVVYLILSKLTGNAGKLR